MEFIRKIARKILADELIKEENKKDLEINTSSEIEYLSKWA